LQKYPVIESEFYRIVVGFADTMPLVQDYLENNDLPCDALGLDDIGAVVIGARPENPKQEAADDAEYLYRIVQQVADTEMLEHK
jgi:hypothetical protein